MRDERGLCELCGQVWCGRPCLNDPKKSNALLFWPDGREKTLRERGLGVSDPPLVTKSEGVTKSVTKRGRQAEGERALTAAERMARMRARRKGKERGE
jgi:hypothetical protein